MTDTYLSLLKCPLCESNFELSKELVKVDDKIDWGVIQCASCNVKYPVAFGIPILKNPDDFVDVVNDFNTEDDIIQQGLKVKEIVAAIEHGEIKKVKKELLLVRFPRTNLKRYRSNKKSSTLDTKLTRVLPSKLVKLIGKRNLYLVYWLLSKLLLKNLRYKKREETTYGYLLKQETAADFINLYFKQSGQSVLNEYFTNRFGMPRHLAGLSLLSVLPKDKRPLLDIACGTGHYMHYFSKRNNNQPVIGMDRTFAQLYIAKKFICPEGNYFCAEADQKLPFKNGFFSGVYCSDAFQYFPNRDSTTSEMKRVLAKDGTICIARVSSQYNKLYIGNAVITPKQLKSYFKELLSVVLDEDDLLEGYLKKTGPNLKSEQSEEKFDKIVWSYIVASNNKNIFKIHSQFTDWPHAIGNLKLNPLYHQISHDDRGNLIYEFKFPSGWYEYENHAWLRYAPKSVNLTKEVLNDIKAGKRTKEVNDLISKFVVLGMPEKYM